MAGKKSNPKSQTHPVFISKAIHVDIATAAAILSGRAKSRITLRQVAELAIVTYLVSEGLPSSVLLQEQALQGPLEEASEQEQPHGPSGALVEPRQAPPVPTSPTGLPAASGALEEAQATAPEPEPERARRSPEPDLVRRAYLDPSHPDHDHTYDPMAILGLRLWTALSPPGPPS